MNFIDENEELYKAWIGEKNQDFYLEKLRNGGFNWCAFFIWDLLFITRKMFLETFILFIGLYVVIYILLGFGFPIELLRLLLMLFMGFSYYPIYNFSIKRKINKYKSKGYSYEEQLEIAKTHGGDKITVGVILMILLIISLSILPYLLVIL